ncbi:hypothetical protein PFISCL1PPCAC_18440 [Pristionchus fissidentatus]|uniref:BZIP domain-containing protein n=1 Tax=Pristionchus fissidentatus TaxID=1538716 RepID=A0AAV5W8U4_9BILA|nr:hypothetical protein PFISCL1PPCAC_18440 [Pristionchus fissidentatus]
MSNRKRKSGQQQEAALPEEEANYGTLGEIMVGEEDYRQKRARNNEAVNRTRQKKKQEEVDTSVKVDSLRMENSALERKVESLQKELSFLKEMFMAYAKKENGAGAAPSQPSNGGGGPHVPGPSTMKNDPFGGMH